MEGADRWMEEFQRVDSEGKAALLLGKSVEGVDGEVDKCMMY